VVVHNTVESVKDMVEPLGHRVVALKCFGYQKTRARRLVNLHPCGGGERWGVHNNSLPNLERALVERVLTVELDGVRQPPPQPAAGHVQRGLKEFKRRLCFAVGRVSPYSTEQFVDTYTGRKRRLYAEVAASLESVPVTRRDSIVNAFIKDEKTNLTTKSDPCPRVIQPRGARFNLAIGVHLKPMEKPIFRGIAAIFGSTTVAKGLNADQRGQLLYEKWSRFDTPVAILLDAKRFDQHVSHDVIMWEHSVFEKIAVCRSELQRLNTMRRPNRCYMRTNDGGFKYTLRGVRMSGDMDTALGNCLTMCAMTFSFATHLALSKFEYLNDGDDGVLIVEGGDAQRVLDTFAHFFLQYGFTMKLEGIAREFEHIDFCQARPVLLSGKYRMVRDPMVCLRKDSLSLKSSTDVTTMRHLRDAIGWCGLSLAGDCPILGEFYHSMVCRPYVAPELFESGMQFLAKGMDPKYQPPTDEARVSFYKAFSITPDMQIALERSIRTSDTQITRPAVLVIAISNYLHSLNLTY